jgi:hypothetical protein
MLLPMPDISIKERVKPPLVRAWFDTVLNPLIGGLRMEADLLAQGDLTWRAHARRFASLVPVRSHLMAEVWDNLDQFVSIYPETASRMEDHDRKLQVLFERASEYYAALIRNATFREMSQRLADAVPSLDQIEAAEVAAEYVFNGVTSLPNYYSTAQFWNAHSPEFLKFREHSDVRRLYESTNAAALDLKATVEQLSATLASLRGELSLEYGVPIVASVAG